jgi:hypothetical protein
MMELSISSVICVPGRIFWPAVTTSTMRASGVGVAEAAVPNMPLLRR